MPVTEFSRSISSIPDDASKAWSRTQIGGGEHVRSPVPDSTRFTTPSPPLELGQPESTIDLNRTFSRIPEQSGTATDPTFVATAQRPES
jgi:hypothetical protein